MISKSNERIAKNTIFLYLRMLVTMSISLYTSRVILDVLGVQDFGLYVVIGGLVGLFSFFSASMQSGIQRFLAFDLGKNNHKRYTDVFNVGLVLYLLIAVFIALLSETIGLWYVVNKLIVPDGREEVALVVFHFTVLSVCAAILRIPYTAGILAQEKMLFFAYVSILESLLKLLAVYILVVGKFDKLILYSFLILIFTILINLVYVSYCKRDSRSLYKFSLSRNKALYFELLFFTNWRLLGASAQMTEREGVALLLNSFFGVVINAANGVAMQINIAVSGLVSSFQQAFMPQITKCFAIGDFSALESLSKRSAKFSFLMVTIFAIPLILNMEYVLGIWLKIVPEYAAQFSIVILLNTLIEAFSAPLWMIILATGRIAVYQFWLATLIFASVVCDYFLLKHGFPAIAVLYVFFATTLLTVFYRLALLKMYYDIAIPNFVRDVMLKPTLLVLLILFFTDFYTTDFDDFPRLILSISATFTIYPALIYFLLLDKDEKQMLGSFYSRILRK